MDDELQYVNLTPAELPGPRAEAGGEGVLYVQDGVVQGPAGEQYVTIMQNGQAYAIPTADYIAGRKLSGSAMLSAQSTALVACVLLTCH